MRTRPGTLLSAIALALAVLVGCTGGGGIGGSAAVSGGSAPMTAPAGQWRGQVLVRQATVVPDDLRQDVLDNRAQIEQAWTVASVPAGVAVEEGLANGQSLGSLEVLDDGSTTALAWPPRPVGQFVFAVGDRIFLTDSDGRFLLDIPAGAGDTLTLVDPSAQMRWTLSVTALVDAGKLTSPTGPDPLPLRFLLPFSGPCGMNAVDEDMQVCGGDPVLRIGAEAARTGGGDRVRNYDPGPLGTYPRPGSNRCITDDGFIEIGGQKRWIFYLNSTCDFMVRHGACYSEYPWTDIEAGLAALLLHENDGLPRYIGGPNQTVTDGSRCYLRHKGRFCDQILGGDLGLEADGQRLLAGGDSTLTVTVEARETVPITVHNNGYYGETVVRLDRAELGGKLEGARLGPATIYGNTDTSAFGLVHHYDPNRLAAYLGAIPPALDPGIYQPDQSLTYTAPEELPPGSDRRDVVEFQVDGRTLTLEFRPEAPTPSPTPSQSPSPAPSPVPLCREFTGTYTFTPSSNCVGSVNTPSAGAMTFRHNAAVGQTPELVGLTDFPNGAQLMAEFLADDQFNGNSPFCRGLLVPQAAYTTPGGTLVASSYSVGGAGPVTPGQTHTVVRTYSLEQQGQADITETLTFTVSADGRTITGSLVTSAACTNTNGVVYQLDFSTTATCP